MGDKTLTDRVIELEDQVRLLRETLDRRLSEVVLVEKRKPGAPSRTVSFRQIKKKVKKPAAVKVKPGYRRVKVVRMISPDA